MNDIFDDNVNARSVRMKDDVEVTTSRMTSDNNIGTVIEDSDVESRRR